MRSVDGDEAAITSGVHLPPVFPPIASKKQPVKPG